MKAKKTRTTKKGVRGPPLRPVRHHPLDDILEPVRRKALADEIVTITQAHEAALKAFRDAVAVAGESYGVKLVATVQVQIET